MIPRVQSPEVSNLALFDPEGPSVTQNSRSAENELNYNQSFASVSSFEKMFQLGTDKNSFKIRSKQRPIPTAVMDAPDYPQNSLRFKGPMMVVNPVSTTANMQGTPNSFSTASKSRSSFKGFGSIKGPIKAFLRRSSKEKNHRKDSGDFSSRLQNEYDIGRETTGSHEFGTLTKSIGEQNGPVVAKQNWKSNSLPRNVELSGSQSAQISGRELYLQRKDSLQSPQKESSFNGGSVNTASNSNSNAFTPPSSSRPTRSTHKKQGSYSGSSGGDSGCRMSGSGGPDSRMGSSDGIQRSAATGAGFKYTNNLNNNNRDNQAFTLVYNGQSGPGSISSSHLSNMSGPGTGEGGSSISFLVEHLTSFTMSREDTLWTVDDAIRKLKLQDMKGKIWSQEMQLDITASALNLVDVESGEQIDSFPYNGITHVEPVILADYHLNSILAFIYRDNTGRKPQIFLFQCDQTPADEVVTDINSAMLAFKKNKSSKYAKAASKSKKKATGSRLGVAPYMSSSASDINMQGQLHPQQNGGLSLRMRSESPGSSIGSVSTARAKNSKLFGEPQHLGAHSGRSSDSGSRPGMSSTTQRRKEMVRTTAQEAATLAGDYRQRSGHLENNSVTYYKDDGSMDDLVDNLQIDIGSPHSVTATTNRSPNTQEESSSQKELSVLQQFALRVERQVAILNHCFDDIELFAKQLKKVHDAQQELKRKKKNGEKKKRPNGAENMLEYRARMPSETSYIDTFQKFKLSFNLLAPLKKHIQQPNAPELVHSLFAPLGKICESEQGMEIATGVLSPLLSEGAVQLLENCLNSEEKALWTRLGSAWAVSKDKWPREHYVPSYKPVFRDGWEPPLLERHSGQERASGGAETSSRPPNARSASSNPNSSYVPNFDNDDDFDQRPLNEAPRSFAPMPHILASNPIAANVIRESNNAASSPGVHGSPPAVVGKPPTSVIATNDFVARNHKELSVLQDEVLEVIDCTRQWWAVRNSSGQTGYAPSTILTPITSTRNNDVTGGGHGDMPHISTFHHQMQNVVNLSNQMMENKILYNQQTASVPSVQQQSYTSLPVASPPVIVHNAPHRGMQQQNGTPPPPPPPPPPVVEQTEPKKIIIPAKKSTPKPKPDQKRNTEGMSEMNGGGESVKLYGSSSNASENVSPNIAAATADSSKQAASVITHSSTPVQVRDWLSSKGFSKLTVDSLGILNGAQLFSLSRQELTDVCFQEGAKVFSFVTVQKSLASNNQQADSNGPSGSDTLTHF